MRKTRNTNQRIKILAFLRGVKNHPSAEEVYNAVRKDLPAITLATVYRNLNLLAEMGEIQRIEVNNEYRFDANSCNHLHCICRNCREVFDLDMPSITEYALKQFPGREFHPECVKIMYSGVCDTCKRGGEQDA